jgi:hypothetical protein
VNRPSKIVIGQRIKMAKQTKRTAQRWRLNITYDAWDKDEVDLTPEVLYPELKNATQNKLNLGNITKCATYCHHFTNNFFGVFLTSNITLTFLTLIEENTLYYEIINKNQHQIIAQPLLFDNERIVDIIAARDYFVAFTGSLACYTVLTL